jgi:hypothetical protein
MLSIPFKQTRYTGNEIQVLYEISTPDPIDDHAMLANNNKFSLIPTDFDFNSKSDYRWDGSWEGKPIHVICKKGYTDVTFSDYFPFQFKPHTENEIERILRHFN